MSAAEAIEEARAALGLPPAGFARVVGIAPGLLQRVQDDEGVRSEVVRRTAEVFGLDVPELLADGVAGRLPTAMLKSFAEHGRDAFDALVAEDVHRKLGSFTRAVRRKSWLRRALGEPALDFPAELRPDARPIPEGSCTPHGADQLAVEVRTRLRLGDARIPSMLSLIRERLNIEVHFSRDLWRRIEGASISTRQARAVLINLGVDGGHKWWTTRMTLAHELCHLLFDGGIFDGARGLLIWSPAASRWSESAGWEPRLGAGHARFLAVEQRANAFSAYFLAPPSGVRALFADSSPPRTWQTVSRVASHFGLSPLTAANVLTNVFQWTKQERSDLLEEIDGEPAPPGPHPDVVSDVPEEDDTLCRLVDQAVARRILLASTRDRWLGHEPAPPARRMEPRRLSPTAAADEIGNLVGGGRVDAALRTLWDSVDAWIDAGDLGACRTLLGGLSPETTSVDVLVSLLAATRRAPALAADRAAYTARARKALLAAGRSEVEVDALVPREAGRGE